MQETKMRLRTFSELTPTMRPYPAKWSKSRTMLTSRRLSKIARQW